MRGIALVTALAARDLDPDLAPLAEALVAIGATPAIECWDDDSVDWSRFDLAVIRSTWDYPQRLTEFLSWVDATASRTRLLNTPATIRWNVDKTYLRDLDAAEIPTVPTIFSAPGEAIALPNVAEVVIKPSVSAGSRDTARFRRDDPAAVDLIRRIHADGRTAMIQPYLHGIDQAGEQALVCIDGTFDHAFRKGPMLHRGADPTTDLFAPEEIGAATIGPEDIDLACAAVGVAARQAGSVPLYARVDLAPGPAGPVVLELELVEPSLYHHVDPGSAGRFAAAILNRAL